MRITIVGGGLAGLCCAYFLRESGAEVTLLEREAGPGLGTSFANGALLHPSMPEPWNSPDLLRRLLHSFGRENAPMLLRFRELPYLVRWGLLFLRNSTPPRFEHNSLLNLALARFSLQELADLRTRLSLDYGQYCRGTLTLFRERKAFDRARAWAERLAKHGLTYVALTTAQTVMQEPALADAAASLVGSLYYPGDEGGDAYRFCTSLAARLSMMGVSLRYKVNARRFSMRGEVVTAVVDDAGVEYSADRFVLAAASFSPLLARSASLHLPIRPVKGYSLTVPANGTSAPRHPVTDTGLHMAVVPLTDGNLRVAGTAEFAGYDSRPTPQRVANLFGLLSKLYPGVTRVLSPGEGQAWAGLRPTCADGVPILGYSGRRNLYLNTGHGHLGWTLAAGAARLVADEVLERHSPIDVAPYRLSRFE